MNICYSIYYFTRDHSLNILGSEQIIGGKKRILLTKQQGFCFVGLSGTQIHQSTCSLRVLRGASYIGGIRNSGSLFHSFLFSWILSLKSSSLVVSNICFRSWFWSVDTFMMHLVEIIWFLIDDLIVRVISSAHFGGNIQCFSSVTEIIFIFMSRQWWGDTRSDINLERPMLWVRDYNKNMNVHFRSNTTLDFTEGFYPLSTDKGMSQSFRFVHSFFFKNFLFFREGETER